jgi:Xaa-Pro aminopeptidase
MQWRAIAAAVFVCLTAASGQQIALDEYKARRSQLREALQDRSGDAVFIAFGASEGEHGDLRTGFFQETNFYYLTGWNEPGAIVVIAPSSEVLFIPKRNSAQEKWTGPKLAPGDAGAQKSTGFESVLAAESFEARLPEWVSQAGRVFTLGDQVERLQRALPLRSVANADLQIARLREKKTVAEIAMIQRSTDVTLAAHRAAWKTIRPGKMEYEIAATMAATYFEAGCARHAYAPIVGSGPNAAVLHYSKNNRRMDSGELLLMDVAAECSMYASDITRTVPVGGKFTPRQRELYDVVLGAQKAAIAAIKPGMTIARSGPNSVHTIAFDYINTHGKDRQGQPLGKYFIHGLSHHVGLDVHDPNDPAQPLAAGMVITVEPGIYIPEESIGIRIEDVILVTEDGAKLLSSALPREADEIEKILARSE